MTIKKYFWGLNPRALMETKKILKNPHHPKFTERSFTLLSRCDDPKELFKVISIDLFIESWPKIRRYWLKKAQSHDFRAWWETIYEQLLKKERKLKGRPLTAFIKIGKLIKNKRLKKNLSQSDLAGRAGMNQPDISAIESGKKNITLETLIRLCKILDIKNIHLE